MDIWGTIRYTEECNKGLGETERKDSAGLAVEAGVETRVRLRRRDRVVGLRVGRGRGIRMGLGGRRFKQMGSPSRGVKGGKTRGGRRRTSGA